MKAKTSILVLSLLLANVFVAMAQNREQGNYARLQDTRRWEKEIPTYKKVLENGEFPGVMEKLADCYRMTGDLEKAEEWYRKAITTGNQNTTCRLNYAKVLQSNGKYQEAKDQFLLYEDVSGEFETGDKYIASCELGMKVRDDKLRYDIQPVSRLNTGASDIVAINSDNEIVFATNGRRKDIGTSKKPHSSSSDYDFYRAKKRIDGSVVDIRPVKGHANSRYDDVGAVKMPGSDLVLFTRSGKQKGKQKKVGGGSSGNHTAIVGAKIKGKKWDDVESMPFSAADGNRNFHPAAHPSGDIVVFASDRPGGYGGVDLYMVKRENGKWGQPVNMGPEVNSEGDELFPTFNRTGNLFFASDGHVGYGGLDLYTADYEDDRWKNSTNMGAGINSSKDDFGIVWDSKTSSGYFNSNRNGETGDDIYRFKRTPGMLGQVFDGMSREPVPGSIVRIKDIAGNEKIIITDGAGQFGEPCKLNCGYLVTVDAPGFHTWRDTFWTKNIPQGRDVNMDIFLEVEQLFEMNGRVVDALADSLLGGSEISIINNKKLARTLNATADSADYRVRLKPGDDYTVIFRQEEYIPRIMNISLTNFRGVEVRTKIVPMVKGDYLLIEGSIIEDGRGVTPISHAAIDIVDNRNQTVIDSAMSLRNGTFWVAVPWDSMANYSIIASKAGYFSSSSHIDVREEKETSISLALRDADFGLDNSIKVINYGYNRTDLDLLSKKDLNEIFFFLTQNPNAKLEVRSHTDSRGSKRYNLELSRRRSQAVIDFIQARRPIPDDRFISWGFGEEYLLNDCVDRKPCGEEDHAINRRTEIKVVEN